MSPQLEKLKAALAGRYEIERDIGQGGMATVYLARDVKHNREVAVKVLRSDLAAAMGTERFLREIEIAANLTHPHILPLHDSGEADGFLYYVMPYIKGDTLRERIDREGELPIAEAVGVIREVVDALAFAHSQGVVHRDIKPDNVMLSGRHAMVMDFGVAKAVSEATGRTTLTTAGVALGTPAYMAPEQATADPHVDHRADIYAVGVMAYELLAGQTPFQRASPQAVLAAHVTEQADPVSKHRDQVSGELEAVIMKCLAKRPADRWQSAEELLPHLEALATPSGGLTPTATVPVTAVRSGSRSKVLPALAAVAVLAFLGWRVFAERQSSVTVASIRQVTFDPGLEFAPRISPSGSEVLYTKGLQLASDLYLQDLAGGRAIPLTVDRPGGHGIPRWTPDGRNVLFLEWGTGEGQATYMMPRLGGTATTIGARRIFALHGDRIAFRRNDSILVRSLSGGAETFVAEAPPEVHSFSWSPDGSLLAFVQGSSLYWGDDFGSAVLSSLWTVALDGGDPVRITNHPTALNISPTWLPDSRSLLFVSNRDGPSDVYLMRLDAAGRPRNDPVRVTTGSHTHTIHVSADGSKAVYSQLTRRRNVWALPTPVSGSVSIVEARPVTQGTQNIDVARVSRDQEWLVYDSNIRGNADIYLRPLAGGEPRQITRDLADEFSPDLSPDGREIVFHSPKFGSRDLFLVPAAGGQPVRITDDPGQDYHPRFSPDGQQIAFTRRTGANAQHVYVVSRDEPGAVWSAPRQISGASQSWNPRWSPDGVLVYHTCHGTCDLHVWSEEGGGRLLLAGADAGFVAVMEGDWSWDGRLVYFHGRSADGEVAIYQMPADGGPVTPLVRYDAANKAPFFYAVADGMLYFTLSELESDIWVMELK